MPLPSFVSVRTARFGCGVLVLACACSGGATPAPAPGPSPSTANIPRGATPAPPPLVQTTWPVRQREHVDLWLHSYALITADTTLVPYFRRSYRDQLTTIRRQRGVSSQLDANRTRLLERMSVNPSLATAGQFLPMYFESWDQMRRTIDLFLRANGNPGASNDPTTRTYIAILAGAFPSAADREWLRLFAESADDESRRFYHDYWMAEQRARGRVVAHVDSLWQRQWRPAVQRFLNNTQQQNGELYLSLPLGGEGRTIHYGKQENAVAVALPTSNDDADVALFVFAHEITGALASSAIEDNTTPAERRTGSTSRYEQAAAVRAGALLLERTVPAVVPGYMRYYLQASGRQAPTDPRAAFVAAFVIPDPVRDAITRQLEVILGGI